MIEIIVTILILTGVMLVAALVFGGWLIVAVVRLIARAIGGGRPNDAPMPQTNSIRCGYPKCRADNAGRARFCRRCGRMLGILEPAVTRKVAMG